MHHLFLKVDIIKFCKEFLSKKAIFVYTNTYIIYTRNTKEKGRTMAGDAINSVKSVNSGDTGKVNRTNIFANCKKTLAERLKDSDVFTVAASAHRT